MLSANLATNTLPSMEMTDADLMRRYGSDTKDRFRKVTCEFTRDVALLHQYDALRERAMFAANEVSPSIRDEHSQVIVARAGLLCVGGGKLTLSSPAAQHSLPMEKHGFKLAQLFPALDLLEVCYGEISDVATLEEFERGAALDGIVQGIVKMAALEKADYLFSLTNLPQARLLQYQLHKIGVNCDIRHSAPIPDCEDFEGVKMVLSVMDMAKYRHMMHQIKRESLMLLESE